MGLVVRWSLSRRVGSGLQIRQFLSYSNLELLECINLFFIQVSHLPSHYAEIKLFIWAITVPCIPCVATCHLLTLISPDSACPYFARRKTSASVRGLPSTAASLINMNTGRSFVLAVVVVALKAAVAAALEAAMAAIVAAVAAVVCWRPLGESSGPVVATAATAHNTLPLRLKII